MRRLPFGVQGVAAAVGQVIDGGMDVREITFGQAAKQRHFTYGAGATIGCAAPGGFGFDGNHHVSVKPSVIFLKSREKPPRVLSLITLGGGMGRMFTSLAKNGPLSAKKQVKHASANVC